MNTLMVTGSSGLIGSEVVDYFSREGWQLHGIDNNMRAYFFGAEGDTRRNTARLLRTHPHSRHHDVDIRNRDSKGTKGNKCATTFILWMSHGLFMPFGKIHVVARYITFGAGLPNSCSILEAFDMIFALSGKRMQYEYEDTPRVGDHICYVSNLSKMRTHYPKWDVTVGLNAIFEQIHSHWRENSG